MDRRAVFTPSFNEFLESQQRVAHQVREQRRFPQGNPGEYKYAASEWKDVLEPSFRQEIIPQTLSEEDVRKDRWPSAIYRFHLANGTVIESFVQKSRDFLSNNVTVDFMGLRRVLLKKGTGTKTVEAEYEPGQLIEEFCWGEADVNQYLPTAGNAGRGGNNRMPAVLEVTEPQPVGS
jgi:hypothetical protein